MTNAEDNGGAADAPRQWARPTTEDELHGWLLAELEIQVPREAIVPGNAAPFEYLCHAFFDERRPRDCVVWANRGGGKTFLAAVATLLDMVFKAGIEIRILGGSLEQSKRMHAHLRALFMRENFSPLVDGRITERRIRLTNGSSVELLAQSQTSVRGTRVQKLRCDEVELFDDDVWEAAQRVTRSKVCGGELVPGSIECLSTMHVPYGLMHRLAKECAGDDPSRRLFRWGIVDVLESCGDGFECESEDGECLLLPECGGRAKLRPQSVAGHITIDDGLTQKRRVGRATWEAEMLCLRPRRSDCVLPEFDVGRHVVTELPANSARLEWIGGMDFGIRAPTVVLWACVRPDGCVVVADEYVKAGAVLSKHIDEIRSRAWPQLSWIGVDPAGRQRSLQTGDSDCTVLKNAGFAVRDRKRSIVAGLGYVSARLDPATGPPRLLVHERCTRLIECLEKYRYPADRPESIEPVKDGSDHAVDALRYMIQSLDAVYETTHSTYISGGAG